MPQKKFYEKSEFKALQAAWYSRLKDEGFRDIEDTKDPDAMIQPEIIRVPKENQLDYYQFCQKILEEFKAQNKFKRDIDEKIFELHADGKTEREIAAWTIQNAHLYSYRPLTHVRIHQIIKQIKEDYLKGV